VAQKIIKREIPKANFLENVQQQYFISLKKINKSVALQALTNLGPALLIQYNSMQLKVILCNTMHVIK
jgi:hypothetical protein